MQKCELPKIYTLDILRSRKFGVDGGAALLLIELISKRTPAAPTGRLTVCLSVCLSVCVRSSVRSGIRSTPSGPLIPSPAAAVSVHALTVPDDDDDDEYDDDDV